MHLVEGKEEEEKKQGRKRQQLLAGLKDQQDIAIWKRKHLIALSGDLTLEEHIDYSQDKVRNE